MEDIFFWKALGLKGLPHIGIYSFNYEWLGITSYYKSWGNEDFGHIVPPLAKSTVSKLLDEQKLKIKKITYLSVNYNSTMFKEKHWNNFGQRWVRFNMVYHPFFMDYLKPDIDEEKKYIMASIYTEDAMMYGIKRSNSGAIMINSDNLFFPQNWIELHVHKVDENDPNAIAVSPNNAAFLMDMTSPIVSFFSIAIEKHDNKSVVDILVTYHWIIDELHVQNLALNTITNTNVLCRKHIVNEFAINPAHILTQLTSSYMILLIQQCDNIQNFIISKTKFYVDLMKSKDLNEFDQVLGYIKMFFWDVLISWKVNDVGEGKMTTEDLENQFKEFTDQDENSKDDKGVLYSIKFKQIDEIIDNFYKFIWSRFTSPIMPNFGCKYIQLWKSTDYMIYLFKGYGFYLGRLYSKVANRNSMMLQQYIEEAFEEGIEAQIFETENIPNPLQLSETSSETSKETEDEVQNPYIQYLENHASEIMLNMENIEAWAGSLLELPEIIQDLIFSTVWNFHGQIDGIHPDFGRMSYINSDEINSCYWTSNEQRLEMILNLTESIRKGDEFIVK